MNVMTCSGLPNSIRVLPVKITKYVGAMAHNLVISSRKNKPDQPSLDKSALVGSRLGEKFNHPAIKFSYDERSDGLVGFMLSNTIPTAHNRLRVGNGFVSLIVYENICFVVIDKVRTLVRVSSLLLLKAIKQ